MRYMLMLYADEKAGAAIPHAEMAKWMDKMYAYQRTLEKAGAFVATNGLARTTEAVTLSTDGGELRVHDGPYAETREQFGGYFIIEAPDMGAAIELAKPCPAVEWGHLEIRAFASFE